MNFGASAHNYAKHRQGFPASFFARVPLKGVVLDLGAGTGTLATGYAQRGCMVCAVDISAEMLRHVHGPVIKIVSRAEDCPFADETFDAVVVGQAWHWFDEDKAIALCRRVLTPGGQLVIASLDYRVAGDNLAAQTERILLKYNPKWPLAGFHDRSPMRVEMLRKNGFLAVVSHEYDEAIEYTHESWRGRMQACNGVMLMSKEDQSRFDLALGELLAQHADPMQIPHRVAWVSGTKP